MTETYQPSLFVESIYQALTDIIRVLGGAKKVGVLLRPELASDNAARWLNDCLNDSRREKLDIEQMLLLLREGRKVGCHIAIEYICQTAGYTTPKPSEPKDEMAELQRQFVESVRAQSAIATRIERLTTGNV